MGSKSVDWVYVIRSGDHLCDFKWFMLPEFVLSMCNLLILLSEIR